MSVFAAMELEANVLKALRILSHSPLYERIHQLIGVLIHSQLRNGIDWSTRLPLHLTALIKVTEIKFPLYIIRHKSADLTELASIVHPYGSTISSLLKFADGDPLHLSEVKQMWANTATVELQVETRHYLSNGEIAVGGVFTLSINLQESIAELYDAVTVAVLDSAPAIGVNISIFFSGRYLNAFSDQPLFLAQLQSHSQIEACIYYPAAPADAIVVRVNTFIITLIVIKIDWHTDPDIWTRTHRRRKKKKMMIMMRIAMKK